MIWTAMINIKIILLIFRVDPDLPDPSSRSKHALYRESSVPKVDHMSIPIHDNVTKGFQPLSYYFVVNHALLRRPVTNSVRVNVTVGVMRSMNGTHLVNRKESGMRYIINIPISSNRCCIVVLRSQVSNRCRSHCCACRRSCFPPTYKVSHYVVIIARIVINIIVMINVHDCVLRA